MYNDNLIACRDSEQMSLDVPCMVKNTGWDALLSLGYVHESGKTTLLHRQHHGPLRVQKALYPEGSAVCHSIVLHPPGGIAGGDTLEIRVVLEHGSQALLTSPGAGKWYRSSGSYASQQLRFTVAENAVLEWLPQETILFDGALARMNMEVELAQGAVFMGWEIVCLGRAASGEKFNHGHLNQRVRIKFAGKPIWQEFGNLQGGDALMNSPAGLAGCTVTATLVLAGKAIPADLLNQCREVAVDGMAGEHCGITVLPDVLIVRYLGNKSEAAKRYFTALWTILRPYAAGRQAVIPRIWQT
ncbi:urease accessory protein UreD 2 [Sulfuriferula nivalis]|uniref:Urease accessory protein UreD n=2 Tax=Sulfuriferula nivalis TaxID=2675298 RepID=A0A809SHD8_9PROT|nr:urease accessory protein UreD 2 [Sulfuriferula nivalis]